MKSNAPLLHHVPAFDGIRAVAVLSVILAHSSYGYFYGGFLGVDFFFVLSGYLITGLLIREQVEAGSIHFGLFYQRRLCRLVPAAVAALALAYSVGEILFPKSPEMHLTWTGATAILFGLANFFGPQLGLLGQSWSLAVEEQFYWIWPGLLAILLRLRRGTFLVPGLLGLILGAGFLRAFLKWRGVEPSFLYGFTPVRIDSLLMGALAVTISTRAPVRQIVRTLARLRLPEFTFLAWILLLHPINSLSPFLYYGGFSLIALVGATVLLCLAVPEEKTLLARFLESRPLRWLGRRSYGIYLYHCAILAALELIRIPHSFFNLALVTALRFGGPILVAALSYHFLELPFLRKKSRLHLRPGLSAAGEPANLLAPEANPSA